MTAPDRFLSERIGLRVDGATRARLDRVVRDAARRAGCPDGRYGRLLEEDPVRAQELIDCVTVQESGFFRHPEQFELLAGHLRATEPGVIWSAGCANGQEPWSLAMLLEEHALPGWTVLATDVSARALARARAGTYEERELRSLSGPRRQRFLSSCGAVSGRLRDRVRILHHNLATAGPPAETFDCRVVLCRNVLIYLHRPAIDGFLERLRGRMAPGSLLMLGMGEALGPLEGFRPGSVAGVFVRTADAPPPLAAGDALRTPSMSLRDEIARRR